jgi:anti-sigma regulatory factor (Ser/Thr protein kinase)
MRMAHELMMELSVPPDWGRIDPIRQAVALCVSAVFADNDLKDSVSMVCAELLENAMKYGKLDAGPVRLSVSEKEDRVVVAVTNAFDPSSTHVDHLKKKVDRIKSFDTPSEAYMAFATEVYEKKDDCGGLGLARIAYEGGCVLDVEADQNVLTVRASCST